MLLPAVTGKIEVVFEGEQKGIEVVANQLVGQAAKALFQRSFPEIPKNLSADDESPYGPIVAWFAGGNEVTVSDEQPFAEYQAQLEAVPGLFATVTNHLLHGTLWPRGELAEAERCFLAELVLEGLHQHVKLARLDLDSKISYKELVKFQLLRPPSRGPRNTN
jgi:magnesium chelatase subunit I